MDGGKWYYVDSSGVMAVEKWVQLGGKWYYFDGHGVMMTGWLYLGKEWYYLGTDGVMYIGGPHTINKTIYEFTWDGKMKSMRLGVIRREQEKSNWCWAACT